MGTPVQRNASNTSTDSNFVLEEIFSDNYTTDGPKLMSQVQDKLLSQQRLQKNNKENNEKR
jgi:hypothetical protein